MKLLTVKICVISIVISFKPKHSPEDILKNLYSMFLCYCKEPRFTAMLYNIDISTPTPSDSHSSTWILQQLELCQMSVNEPILFDIFGSYIDFIYPYTTWP